ncbi:MAG TPA: tripartite tricarboxylate transporter substrate binding protein [Burkholderiaceae bacterium]|nr:tripartite tricarboxylate transporter substrate binding protein [Burkholderiaceae bacterium]
MAAIVMTLPGPSVSHAQEHPWPAKPIRLIVPGGAGGVLDIRARWLAERLAQRLNQNVYVENLPGAGGNLGTALAAHAAPDGYTLTMIHQGTMAINPHLYMRPGYDPLKDLTPIARIGVGPLLLAVNSALRVTSVAQLVALAKDKPGQLTFGSPGIGTPPHMAGELFQSMAGIHITHVPYRGGAQAVSDLIGGQITMSIEGMNVQLPFVRSGQLRALAVTGPRRLAMLPDVPTMAEAGVAGYEFIGWVGIAAPVGTPAPIVDRLHRDIAAVLASAQARDWFASYGLEPGEESADAFTEQIRGEYARFGRLIHAAGIKAE